MVNPYPLLVGPSPRVKGTIPKLRKNSEVFGVERNYQYVYDRKLALWSEHKSLEIISKKPLATAPKRLRR